MHAGECARYITYHIQEVLEKNIIFTYFWRVSNCEYFSCFNRYGNVFKIKRFKITDDFNQKTFQVRPGTCGRDLALFLYNELISFIILIKVKRVTHTYFRVMNMITLSLLRCYWLFQHFHLHVDQLLTAFFSHDDNQLWKLICSLRSSYSLKFIIFEHIHHEIP